MDYEQITFLITVRLVLINFRPVYHIHLLHNKFIPHYLLFLSMSFYHTKFVTWSNDGILKVSLRCLTLCPLLLFYTCIMHDIYIIYTCMYYISYVFIFTKPIDNNSPVGRNEWIIIYGRVRFWASAWMCVMMGARVCMNMCMSGGVRVIRSVCT